MTDNIILYTIDDSKAKAELYKFDESLYLVQNAIAKFLPSQSKTQVCVFKKLSNTTPQTQSLPKICM